MNGSSRIAALAALVAVLLPGVSAAQTYRWTDDNGRTNYTQGLDSVPERHRSSARLVGATETAPAEAAPAAGAPAPGGRAASAPGVAVAPARIPFVPGQPIVVTALINGTGTARLLLDTGASITVINPRTLAAFGVGMRAAQRATLKGITGDADAFVVQLESLEVAGARVGPLLVASHDSGGEMRDGLLGRNFLDRFTVNIDNAAGVVTLTPK